jgi:hypothetical protein
MTSLLKSLNEMAVGHGKVYAKMQGKLQKLDVVASIDAIRDFFENNKTPRRDALVKKLEKLGYESGKEWLGNESFFQHVGVSKDDFMAVAKEVNETLYDVLKFGEKHVGKTQITEKNGCPTKSKKMKSEDEEEKKDENLGDEELLPKKLAKELKKASKKDDSEKKFKKEYPGK